jgi:hypothetical protein
MIGRHLAMLTIACATSFCAGEAGATALIGGTVSTLAGSGTCNDNKTVSTSTSQDSFALNASTGCSGGSASGSIRGDAATASVGIKGSSSGNGFGSSEMAGEVTFIDKWLLNVPAGTAAGVIHIPVSITLEGNVSSGALFDTTFAGFMTYDLSISDFYAPSNAFSAIGKITADGNYSETFNGSVNLTYWGPDSLAQTTADVEMTVFIPALIEGTVDFYNTASIALDLPDGFSATTSSGLPLDFATSTPPTDPGNGVPEPLTLSLFAAGLVGAAATRRGSKSQA